MKRERSWLTAMPARGRVHCCRIARNPFIYFPCKRGRPENSNIHRVLNMNLNRFTEFYDDYRSSTGDLVGQASGHFLTGDVKKQSELFFGKLYELISPQGSRRPHVHAR